MAKKRKETRRGGRRIANRSKRRIGREVERRRRGSGEVESSHNA